ncbi:methionyl-tRNA formyltransferase [Halobium salinum]|uniref:phosphoribosylglycinamide formyltransferase 1 n=2 Tax=Halobium salinum TaxID=1364940 RepID=A0ABD5PAH2_9EURY
MLTERDQLPLVERLAPDMVVAVGFRHILPPEILSVPERGCLNLHPGLLPETRGFNPNVWSIVEDRPAGATLHFMDEGVDAGPIVARREVPTRFDDTGKDVYERIEAAAIDLFEDTWPAIATGEIDTVPQPDFPDDGEAEAGGTEVSYHVKEDFVDLCELDPDASYNVKELLDLLRALTFPPFDNASVTVDGERYYVEVDIHHEDEANHDAAVGALESY